MKRLLAASLLTIWSCGLLAGCAGPASRTVADDLKTPVYLENAALPAPKMPAQQFGVEVFRLFKPILQKQHSFMVLRQILMSNTTRKALPIEEVFTRSSALLDASIREVHTVEEAIRRVTPVKQTKLHKDQLLVGLKSYRQALETTKMELETKNVHALNRNLEVISSRISDLNRLLKLY